MITMISLKCPECRADLSIEDGCKECFCQFCGAKILIDDGSTTHTYRKIDEARIKEAEIRLRELEIEEKERALENELERKAMESRKKIRIALVVIGLSLFLVEMLVLCVSGRSLSGIGFLWGLILIMISGLISNRPNNGSR